MLKDSKLEVEDFHIDLDEALGSFRYHKHKSCPSSVDPSQTDFHMTGAQGLIVEPETISTPGFCSAAEFSAFKLNLTISGFVSYPVINHNLAHDIHDEYSMSAQITSELHPEMTAAIVLDKHNISHESFNTLAFQTLVNSISGYMAHVKTQCPNFFSHTYEGMDEEQFDFHVAPAPSGPQQI